MTTVSKLISLFIIVLLLITFPALSCGARILFTHSDDDTVVSKERQQQYLRMHRNLNRIEERIAPFEAEPFPYSTMIRAMDFSS
ncbi:unnamed protein product [Eruca vesicaria subsp. sativa]|uniref:Uncharacterized protein n=1 Tax=Eruca vesicaria subsp. sativa TaxID=29727 RepID=A0ABC8KBI2_ERUVS|nr:unnamed protein product [Eruca vesicaria subsp. sativa]